MKFDRDKFLKEKSEEFRLVSDRAAKLGFRAEKREMTVEYAFLFDRNGLLIGSQKIEDLNFFLWGFERGRKSLAESASDAPTVSEK